MRALRERVEVDSSSRDRQQGVRWRRRGGGDRRQDDHRDRERGGSPTAWLRYHSAELTPPTLPPTGPFLKVWGYDDDNAIVGCGNQEPTSMTAAR